MKSIDLAFNKRLYGTSGREFVLLELHVSVAAQNKVRLHEDLARLYMRIEGRRNL